jgi:nucleoside 2-deoxyribosyltransferase
VDKKQVIYLSGPMSGISDYNFPEFERIANQLRGQGYEVISPAEIEQPVKTWAACMRNDIPELMKADTLALLRSWESSSGAGLEIAIAVALHMPIVDAYTLEPIELNVNVDIKSA